MTGNKMSDRKTITDRINLISLRDIDGPIDDVIERLQKVKRTGFEQGYRNICIEQDHYDEYDEIIITGDRAETDEEMNKRIANNKKKREKTKLLKKQKEQQEREEYERLRKKFE